MRFLLCSLLLLVCHVDNGTPNLIGGCAGTQYGCCSDGVTASRGPAPNSGCPTKTMAECATFLAGLPLTCTTRTNCLELDCYLDVFGFRIEMDFIVHRCADPVSVNVTVIVDQLGNFHWTHEFTGNTSLQIPGLVVSLGAIGTILVSADVHIYKRGNDVYMSSRVLAYIDSPTPLVLADETILRDDKLPVSTVECSNRPPASMCSSNCKAGNCLWGLDGGAVCYKCPDSSPCPISLVCGSDFRSYNSHCALGRAACTKGKEITVIHAGRCSGNERPTSFEVLAGLPPSKDLSGNAKKFVDSAVVALIFNVTTKQAKAFTKASIAEKLNDTLPYRIVVLSYAVHVPQANVPGDSPQAMATFFAYYFHSNQDAVVPVAELVSAVKARRAQVAQALGAPVADVKPYDSSFSSSTSPSSKSNTSIIIISAVVSVTGAILVTLLVLTVAYYVRKKLSSSNRASDTVYLPENDVVSFESPTYEPSST